MLLSGAQKMTFACAHSDRLATRLWAAAEPAKSGTKLRRSISKRESGLATSLRRCQTTRRTRSSWITKVPRPCSALSKPSRTKSSIARRKVPRLTPKRSIRLGSVGSGVESERVRSKTSRVSESRTCSYNGASARTSTPRSAAALLFLTMDEL